MYLVRSASNQIFSAAPRSELAAGPSTVFTDVTFGLRDRSQLYVHWSRELVKDEDRDVPAEHQLIAGTLARDTDGTAEALQNAHRAFRWSAA